MSRESLSYVETQECQVYLHTTEQTLLLGAISPFLTLKRYTPQVVAGGTYSIPGWSPSSLVLMTTQTHGGDTNHLYFGNTSLHAGTGLKITFSDGVITSTDNVAQSIRITMLSA